MTMVYWGGVIGVATLIGAGTVAVTSSVSTGAKKTASANQQKQRLDAEARKPNIGNLSKDEASKSASKKAMREGLFFTSPTGLGTGGSRGRSRLMGS